MKNLTQIKSGQLEKIINKQIASNTTSSHHIDQENIGNNYPILKRSPNYQNHYRLSNAVKQVLQMKPRTAAKISQHSSRNHKTQIIADFKPSLQFFTNKCKRNNHKDLSDNVQQEGEKNSLGKEKIYLNCGDNKLLTNKVITSKSSRALRREPDANQTLKKAENISKTNQNQCRIRITKRRTEFSAPKSKITIKNIDSLIEIQPRKTISRGKLISKYDLNPPKYNITKQFKQDQLSEIKQLKQKKSKKSITDIKIPQFIKLSLEIYQQEPIYLIQQLQKRKKRQCYAEREEQQKPCKVFENNQQNQQVEGSQFVQNQNILANKMKLIEKQKRKPIIHAEPSQEISENIATQDEKIEKRPTKSKSKKREQLEQKLNICGWEEENGANIAYFQF